MKEVLVALPGPNGELPRLAYLFERCEAGKHSECRGHIFVDASRRNPKHVSDCICSCHECECHGTGRHITRRPSPRQGADE